MEVVTDQRLVKGERFRLTQNTTDVSAKTDAQVENYAVRYSFAPIWTYQIPVNQHMVIEPKDRLSIYLENDEASSAEWGNPQKVRVVVWDATLKRSMIIYEGLYMESKEEQDDELMAHFDLHEGKPLLLNPGDWVYIEGKCDDGTTAIYTIDVSDSRFSIEMTRVRLSGFKA